MKRYFPCALAYLLCLGLGTVLGATTEVHPAPFTPQNLLPAAAQIDSLPMGRHSVSSFRNGSSFAFIVEDGEILEIKVDGQEIAAADFPQYQQRVEEMLGGRTGSPFTRQRLDVFQGLDQFKDQNEDMQLYFREQGEAWERMGEEVGKRFENMFQFDEESGTMRFEFDSFEGLEGQKGFEFNLDSMMNGQVLRFNTQPKFFDMEELLREKEQQRRSPEDEIEELETMIQRMERRKAEAQKELEDRASEEISMGGFSFEGELKQLRSDGLIAPGVIRSFQFSQKALKVNGKKASAEAHQKMLEAYRKGIDKQGKFKIALDGLEI